MFDQTQYHHLVCKNGHQFDKELIPSELNAETATKVVTVKSVAFCPYCNATVYYYSSHGDDYPEYDRV